MYFWGPNGYELATTMVLGPFVTGHIGCLGLKGLGERWVYGSGVSLPAAKVLAAFTVASCSSTPLKLQARASTYILLLLLLWN